MTTTTDRVIQNERQHIQSMNENEIAKARVQFNPSTWGKLSTSFMDFNHPDHEEEYVFTLPTQTKTIIIHYSHSFVL
ncbi:hypothetical protein D3C80_1745530 [compost metagenome]